MKEHVDVGIPVSAPPKEACSDRHCPFHGFVKLHGRIFTGKVVNDVFHTTMTIEFPRQYYLPKYERFEKRRTRIKVHVPGCMRAGRGDMVRVMETRPISKTKHCVMLEVVKR